ncbi:MAG TPA: aspartate dehydrogenase [Acidovorax sp.]|nr:aspartate dehydrogenase [Acidovorax sp.]
MRADSPAPTARIALIGYGALGRYLLRQLTVLLPQAQLALVVRHLPAQAPAHVALLTDAAMLQAWQPTLLIECAGHGAVRDHAPAALRAGVDVIVASVGALADGALHTYLRDCARAGGSRLIAVPGAIGGLDALKAARGAGLSRVRYIGRKPPMAWGGTPAADRFDLAAVQAPTVIFEGSAGESARSYPKNANVTAAVALAGVGFEQTLVTLVADPSVTQNCHELEVIGAFGEFHIRMANTPLPENPKTSWLTALSIEAQIRDYFDIF